jgi:hypothetical protein
LGVRIMKHTFGSHKLFKSCAAAVGTMLILCCFFPVSSWSLSKRFTEGRQLKNIHKYTVKVPIVDGGILFHFDRNHQNTRFGQRRSYLFLTKDDARSYNRLSPEEKIMLQRRLKEWESLSPERQRILRHRMEEYNRLPPRQRQLFRQRYRRLQQLSPNERQEIQEKLRRWNTLPPAEREQIRKRFREP